MVVVRGHESTLSVFYMYSSTKKLGRVTKLVESKQQVVVLAAAAAAAPGKIV
jgi:hypothetical protein